MREIKEEMTDDIREFFNLKVQAKIIKAAQNYNNIYEEAIGEFAKLFYAKLCQCISNTNLNDEKNRILVLFTKMFLKSKVNCSIKNIPTIGVSDNKTQDIVPVSSVVYFFQEIVLCYKCWCTCDLSGALQIVEELLEKTGNSSIINIDDGDVFYRGRMAEKNIDKSDMFHIPFKKAYLIKNQRFSVTGQPVLYITDKPVGLINELELKNENEEKIFHDLHVSRFEYNDSENSLNLFDFRIEKKLDFESYEEFEEYNRKCEKQWENADGACLRDALRDEEDDMQSLNGLLDRDFLYTDEQAQASVRDGAASLEVLVLQMGEDGRIHTATQDEATLSLASTDAPSREEAKIILRQSIRLPRIFSFSNGTKAIEELEEVRRNTLSEWARTPSLSHELFLLLDLNGCATLAGIPLRYDWDKGLCVEKEDRDGRNHV